MPSDLSTWLVSVPQNGDSEGLYQELSGKFTSSKQLPSTSIAEFNSASLEFLVTLSDELPKHDAFFTTAVAKSVDTLRNLVNNDAARLAEHIQVDERPVNDYLLRGWTWNSGQYGTQRSLREIVDALVKEMSTIDTMLKNNLNNYNLAKGSLTQLQRKYAGNLSTKSLVGLVSKDQITDTEYLETIFVAVPKNNVSDWNSKYERLAPMVVPRSSEKITQDDDFVLFRVIVFRKTRDEFTQKCRENKFNVREFSFEDDAVEKQRGEIERATTAEKELWSELLRIARTSFSEGYKTLVHLKVLRTFVESSLEYGPPAHYTGVIIKPDPKTSKRVLSTLTSHFSYLPRKKSNGKSSSTSADVAGEYATLMEEEKFDFVLFEVPNVV
ncbi:ATPase, V1 complex, subunit C [Clavulina sp. PMI_390]|nr:ATPase, V1 complex, subunit C [Clavulina sp. PMI_390]